MWPGEPSYTEIEIEVFQGTYDDVAYWIKNGSEPNCQVTREYNHCLKQYLPPAGIKVEEIDRLEIDKRPVSASDVRCAYKEGRLEEVKKLVPETTYQYLQEHKK